MTETVIYDDDGEHVVIVDPSVVFTTIVEDAPVSEVEVILSMGPKGDPGISAYEEAVSLGFVGTEEEWLDSLVGPEGPEGIQGEQGDQGEEGDPGPQGEPGPDRFLNEVDGVYPPRPDSDPVVFTGETDPDSLGLMLDGDTWIATGTPGTGDPGVVYEVAGLSGQVSAFGLSTALHVIESPKFDVRDFLLDGEEFPDDGILDASPLVQRTIEAAAADYVTYGLPVQIYVPPGRYKLLTNLIPRSGVGIVGASRTATVFYPYNDQCFMKGDIVSSEPVGGWAYLDDMHFYDFGVDGINQVLPNFSSSLKGFFMQNVRRAKFTRLSFYNTWASMYGMDFMIDCEFTDCFGKGSGRGAPASHESSGSTFAFGVGRFQDESLSLTDCTAVTSAAAGYYFERLEARAAFYQRGAFVLTACRGRRNAIGCNDSGTGGIVATGCDFSYNTYEGWRIGDGGQSTVGGRDGKIVGTTFEGNGAHGLVFKEQQTGGGYVVTDSNFLFNTGDGIRFEAGLLTSPGGVQVISNTLRGNTGLAINVVKPQGRLSALSVLTNLIADNAGGGIFIGTNTALLVIKGNTFSGLSQPYACTFDTGITALKPRIEENRFIDQAIGLAGTSGFDQTYIRENDTDQSLNGRLKTITGTDPVKIATASANADFSSTPIDAALGFSFYVYCPTVPVTGNAVQLQSATNAIYAQARRETTGYSGIGYNSAGTSANAVALDAVAAPFVSGVVRTLTAINVKANGRTAASTNISTIRTGMLTKAVMNSRFSLLIIYREIHSDSIRDQVVAAIAEEFGL